MPEPSFPPDSIRAPLVVRKTVSFAGGQALVVGASEMGVFVQGGRVFGTLGPGSHLLDPRALPFLNQIPRDPPAEVFVVTVAVHGVRIRGATGEIYDTAPGLALSPRIFGEVGVRIVDPARAVLVAASVPSGDPDGTLRGHVLHAIIEGAKTALVQAGHEGRLVRLLADRAAQPELSSALTAAAAPRLAEFGVEIAAFGNVVVALSEEDMAKVGAVDVTAPLEPVYEMLWDCKFCGKAKLLGLTHRHCPNCGAPQNAEGRYFPSDADKVPAKSHEYYGADLRCTHCGVANGKNSKHCAGCGAPLEGAAEVARRNDQSSGHNDGAIPSAGSFDATPAGAHGLVDGPGVKAAPRKRSGLSTVLWVSCLVVVVIAVAAAAFFLWKKPGGIAVVGHSWKRAIDVERYGPVSDSGWCDQLPLAARSITRRREVRSHERIADGQDCQIHKVDRGNGTFAEKQECTPRYRDEPVYGERCYFTVDRWQKTRTESAEGASLSDAPRWPDPKLARAGSCEGCERPGSREETYTVVFKDDDGREHSCNFEQARWASISDGSHWKGDIGVASSVLDCATVAAP